MDANLTDGRQVGLCRSASWETLIGEAAHKREGRARAPHRQRSMLVDLVADLAEAEKLGVRAKIRWHTGPLIRVEPKLTSGLVKTKAALRFRNAESKATIDVSRRGGIHFAKLHHASHKVSPTENLLARRPPAPCVCHDRTLILVFEG
jgi:hypothetical protein